MRKLKILISWLILTLVLNLAYVYFIYFFNTGTKSQCGIVNMYGRCQWHGPLDGLLFINKTLFGFPALVSGIAAALLIAVFLMREARLARETAKESAQIAS